MAGSKYVPFVGPSYHLADRKAAVQRSVNCYPRRLDGNTYMMQSAPGQVQVADLGSAGRNSRTVAGRLFTVAGNTLYENLGGTYTSRGTLASSSGHVGMADNKTQLALVDGSTLYIFTLSTNTLTTVASAGWRGSDEVVEIDGYFVFVDPDTDQFYLSAIDDGSTLDALDFSSADSSPDDIVTHRVSHRQLWLFGELTTEIWINSGGADFPFVRYQSYTLDVGCIGKRAAINAADTLFWIGKTRNGQGIVYMASGNQPQRVSTNAVEEALMASTDLSLATMWTYQVEGQEFIGINAPGLTTTWVFDAANQLWHERGEWNAGWEPQRAELITAFDGEHYATDSDGIVTRLDATLSAINGRVLRRERTWPHMIQPSLEPVSYMGVELACTTGYGGQIALECSNDGGKTFGPALLRGLGATGRWMQRIRWNALGVATNRVFRIWQTDDVPFAIHSASVDV